MKKSALIFAIILGTTSAARAQFKTSSFSSRTSSNQKLSCLGSDLVNQRGTVLWSFSNVKDCEGAVATQRDDLLCLNDNTQSLLFSITGKVIKKLGNRLECMSALQLRRGDLLCAKSGSQLELVSVSHGSLRTLDMLSDCKRILDEQVDGFACAATGHNFDLMDLLTGKSVLAFNFESDCLKAQREASSGYICAAVGTEFRLISSEGELLETHAFESNCQNERLQRILDEASL